MDFVLANASWGVMIATVASFLVTSACHGPDPSRWNDLAKTETVAVFVGILAIVGAFMLFQVTMFLAGEQAARL